MRWSDVPRSPTPSTLRQFAALWLACFGGLACWQGLGRGNLAASAAVGALAVSVGALGLIRPRGVRPIFVTWMVLAFPVGWAVSHLLLAALYYGLITPIGLVSRLAGRDALLLRGPLGRDSYWLPKAPPSDVRSYFRPY
jgi:hypothetical protein